MSKKPNRNIGCSVGNCQYNEHEAHCCTLDNINICNCTSQVCSARDSMCASFRPVQGGTPNRV